MQSVHKHKRRCPVSLGCHVGATCWIPCENGKLCAAFAILPLGGRRTVEGSYWLTQFFCLFGVFSISVCFLFRTYSLIFESCAIVCTVQCYLWDKAAHSRPTIVLLNWTEIRAEWRLSSYHLEELLSINQPLTAGQQQGAQTGGQFRQITGPNINKKKKKDMNYIAHKVQSNLLVKLICLHVYVFI